MVSYHDNNIISIYCQALCYHITELHHWVRKQPGLCMFDPSTKHNLDILPLFFFYNITYLMAPYWFDCFPQNKNRIWRSEVLTQTCVHTQIAATEPSPLVNKDRETALKAPEKSVFLRKTDDHWDYYCKSHSGAFCPTITPITVPLLLLLPSHDAIFDWSPSINGGLIRYDPVRGRMLQRQRVELRKQDSDGVRMKPCNPG